MKCDARAFVYTFPSLDAGTYSIDISDIVIPVAY